MAIDYQGLWDLMIVTDESDVISAAKEVLKHKDRYMAVVEGTNVPWQTIGVTHYREADCDFTCHPHNGDSLQHRTVNVPSGRPVAGNPPFAWEDSAKDCYFNLNQWDKVETWNIVTILSKLEAFNGFGYRDYHPTVLTPYLWSGTNNYTVGKYASDGKFDPTLKDKEMGCAPIYRYLTDTTLNLV